MIAGALLAMTLAGAPLEDLRWAVRPVLVFGQEARCEPEDLRPAITDRDILVLCVTGHDVTGWPADPPDLSATALREAYDVRAAEPVTILVGKDGGEKGRWDGPPPWDDIFAAIDAMPMRAQEMREGR